MVAPSFVDMGCYDNGLLKSRRVRRASLILPYNWSTGMENVGRAHKTQEGHAWFSVLLSLLPDKKPQSTHQSVSSALPEDPAEPVPLPSPCMDPSVQLHAMDSDSVKSPLVPHRPPPPVP